MAITEIGPSELAALVVAAGAIGTAAMGIVDTLKSRESLAIGGAGFADMIETLEPLRPALERAFGEQWRHVLEIHYRGDHAPEAIKRVVSRAVRLGLPELTVDQLNAVAARYGNLDRQQVRRAIDQLRGGQALDSTSHGILERLMAAVDAHVEGAALRASAQYRYAARAVASAVAIALGAAVGLVTMFTAETVDWTSFLQALFLGVVAVPVAPIAKDLSTAVKNFSVRP